MTQFVSQSWRLGNEKNVTAVGSDLRAARVRAHLGQEAREGQIWGSRGALTEGPRFCSGHAGSLQPCQGPELRAGVGDVLGGACLQFLLHLGFCSPAQGRAGRRRKVVACGSEALASGGGGQMSADGPLLLQGLQAVGGSP